MILNLLRRQGFIFWAISALLFLDIPLGWGTNYLWNSPTDGIWITPSHWRPSGPPGPTDTAEFDGGESVIIQATSVGGLTYDLGFSQGSQGSLSFLLGQTLGPAGGNGNAVTNNTGNNQAISMDKGTVQGGTAGDLSFGFLGASTYLADGNPTVSGVIEVRGGALTVATTQSDWPKAIFNGAITGIGEVVIGDGIKGVQASFGVQNSYSGGTSINGGILLTASSNLPVGGAVTLSNSGQLSFQDTNTETFSGSISGSGNVQLENSGILTLSHPITGYISLFNNGGGTLILTNSGNNYNGQNSVIESGSTLQGTSQTISAGAPISYGGGGGKLKFTDSDGETYTWSGTIVDNSGGGAPLTVEHSGTNRLTLSQPPSGNMAVKISDNSGTLILQGTGAATSYSGTTTLTGNIEYQNGFYYLPGQVTGSGTLTVSNGGSVGLGSSQNTNTGEIIVNNGSIFLYDENGLGNRTTNGLNLTSSVFGLFPLPLSGGSQTVNPGPLTLNGNNNTFAMGINATNSTIMDLTANPNLDLSAIKLQVINNSPSALYGPSQEFTLFTNAGHPTHNFNQATLLGLDAFTGFVDPATLGADTIKYIVQKKSDGNVQVAANSSIVTGHTFFKTGQILTSTLNSQRQAMRNEGGSFGGLPSFQGNPIKAPEVDVSYLSLTDGGLDRAVEENMKCWNPLRSKKTSLWAQPFGLVLNQGMVDGVPGFSSRTGGILFGMDHKVNSGLLVGGGLGYAYTKMSIDQNLGKSRVKDRFGTVFTSFFGDAWHVDLAVVAGFQHHRGDRTVEGTNLRVESQHNGYQVMPHIGGGYTFGMNDCYQIHTFAQLDYVYSHENRYQEHGANIRDFFIEAHDASMLRSEAGFHVAQICDLETAQWLRSVKLSLVNKAPLKKGPIVSSYGDSAQSTNLNTTFISPGVKSTLQYGDGFSVGFNYNAEISLSNKTTSQEIILRAGQKF